MNKAFSWLRWGLKYSFYGTSAISAGSFAYLQYVNSVLGPIKVDKQTALDFYREEHHMGDDEAMRTYYWVIFHISLARITNFSSYKSYCEKFSSKILEPTLNNYQKAGVLAEILKREKKERISRAIFNKIVDIRRLNTDNIELREYIIKEIRTLQKEMDCNLLLGVSEQAKGKVDRIHDYICDAGRTFRDPEIIRYISKLPEIEKKYPGDYLHKILFI